MSRKYQWLRRAHRPFVQRFVGLSEQLVAYLRDRVGVPPSRLVHICNGVDTVRFAPVVGRPSAIPGCPFEADRFLLVGTVGRMHGVKDQLNLTRAFLRLIETDPAAAAQVRLVMDFATALGMQRYVVGGHSLVGTIALHVAVTAPRVPGLVLMNPGIITTGVPPITQYLFFPLPRAMVTKLAMARLP